ncbi:hypothetical protein ACFCX3_32970 [Streptomyces virginiae]|uniref:hypothetical protein n=1 Tax=Streptomyces TaxID=1883 RepID=UPI00131E290D|nr:hypothetical protein [Streptomyces sp. WM6349]
MIDRPVPGEACACARHDCGGVVPVSWCPSTATRCGTPVVGSAAPTCPGHVASRPPGVGQTDRLTDDEKSDVLREGIEDYLVKPMPRTWTPMTWHGRW